MTLAILGELFDPHSVQAMRQDVLTRFLARHASGNHTKSGPFVDDLVEKLKAAASEKFELQSDSVDFEALQFEVAHLRMWVLDLRLGIAAPKLFNSVLRHFPQELA